MPDLRAFLFFRGLLLLAAAAISLPLMAGFFGDLHPAFDSTAHFRVHLAVLLTAVSVPLLAGTRRWPGVLAMFFGILALATVSGAPGLGVLHASFQPKDPESAVYRLLQMNLRFDNSEPGKVISLIGRVQPDVLTLEEVSPMWDAKLERLAPAYPYRIGCRERDFGVAILSRRPLPASAGCSHDGALVRTMVDFGGRRVEIAALHLEWPWPFDQPAQLDGLAPALGELAGTALVAGDLNATPWSAAARRIADEGALSPIGPLGPTWLWRRLPDFLRFAGLAIDQVFARGDVVVHDARVLEPAGSDHLPVLVEFSLKPPDTGSAIVRLAGAPSEL